MDENVRRRVYEGPLSWRGRLVIAALLLGVVAFGAIVVKRSAFSDKPRTDAVVFFRAAWAVRAGEDIYQITANWWHYHYPPLFAIAMTPLADPPEGVDRRWVLPLWGSVAAWYLMSVLCLVLAAHWLAQACEEADPRLAIGGRWSRGWWIRRIAPVLICLPQVGNTLGRGQVNLLLLLLIAGAALAMVRRRWVAVGVWLAAGACLKVIPAYLMILPLWRRHWRCLVGCAAGLALGLVVIPSLTIGPARTWQYAHEWVDLLAKPAMGGPSDGSRDRELFDLDAKDDQSIQGVIHAWTNLGTPAKDHPKTPAPWTRGLHLILGGLLTLVTLVVGGARRSTPLVGVLSLGLLTCVMLMITPVCHDHYFALAATLVSPLVAAGLACEDPGRRRLACALWISYVAANTLPLLPGLQVLRHVGLPALAGLGLWGAGIAAVRSVAGTGHAD